MSSDRFLQELRGILQPGLSALSETLGAALNRTVGLHLGEIRPVDVEELQTHFPGDVVLGRAVFTEGLAEEFTYLLPTHWAAVWAAWMIMGEGKEEFSAAVHLDGITELLNQVSGSLSQYLSSSAGFSIRIGGVQPAVANLSAQAGNYESCFRADLLVKTEGQEQAMIALLISPDAVRDLQKIQMKKKEEMSDRPPPAARDDEPELPEAPEVRAARFEDFSSAGGSATPVPQNIDVLMDLELPVIIELGRTSMFIRDILDLGPGSIVELSKLSGEPVDLFVNDKKFAQGEVVVIDENFGIRITDLVKVEDRIRSLK